jgi:hypothetical protein
MHGYRRAFIRCFAALGLIALLMSGCVSSRRGLQRASASHLAATATSYNLAIEETQNEMLLLNAIRAMNHQPMYVTDASKVTGTVKVDLSLGLKLPFHGAIAGGTSDHVAMPNFDYSSSPAMDVNLLNSKDFMTGFLAPIQQEFFAYYWDQGWPSEFVLNLLVLKVDIYEKNGSSWSLKCTLHNHPDVYDPELKELKNFATWINSQVLKGRPRLHNEDARDTSVGPPLSPTTLDTLVTVGKEVTLSLSPAGVNWQLKRQKKVYTLIPVASAMYACPKEVSGGESHSWVDLTEKTPNQIVIGSETDQRVFALSLRSAEGVLYYLGQLARLEAGVAKQTRGRAVMIHVCDYDQNCATDKGELPTLPLFVALSKQDHSCSDTVVSVRSLDGNDYFIPKGNQVPPLDRAFSPLLLTDTSGLCAEGRSMMAMNLVAQLIGLQKTAKDFSTTSTVKVVGQ